MPGLIFKKVSPFFAGVRENDCGKQPRAIRVISYQDDLGVSLWKWHKAMFENACDICLSHGIRSYMLDVWVINYLIGPRRRKFCLIFSTCYLGVLLGYSLCCDWRTSRGLKSRYIACGFRLTSHHIMWNNCIVFGSFVAVVVVSIKRSHCEERKLTQEKKSDERMIRNSWLRVVSQQNFYNLTYPYGSSTFMELFIKQKG